jgi:hypothetical protein
MAFVPLFAAALALSDGGHHLQIQQIAGSEEIVLVHDEHRLLKFNPVVEVSSMRCQYRLWQLEESSNIIYGRPSVRTIQVEEWPHPNPHHPEWRGPMFSTGRSLSFSIFCEKTNPISYESHTSESHSYTSGC